MLASPRGKSKTPELKHQDDTENSYIKQTAEGKAGVTLATEGLISIALMKDNEDLRP